MLDRIVPGYYQRLNAVGNVETSTCCQNVATEHEVAEKLMVDSVVLWAKEYKVDGFRFDLMGHHSKQNLLAVRAALDELTLAERRRRREGRLPLRRGLELRRGREQRAVRAGHAGPARRHRHRHVQRPAARRACTAAARSTARRRSTQGYGTGLGTDPNGQPGTPSQADQLADLGHQTDLVKLGLAGNLRGYELTDADGRDRCAATSSTTAVRRPATPTSPTRSSTTSTRTTTRRSTTSRCSSCRRTRRWPTACA